MKKKSTKAHRIFDQKAVKVFRREDGSLIHVRYTDTGYVVYWPDGSMSDERGRENGWR